MEELWLKKNINFKCIYNEIKDYLFPILFYIIGLIIGCLFYSKLNMNSAVKLLLTNHSSTIINIFFNRLCAYISVYMITILLGMCIIGYPFINILPLAIGIEIAIKISYYYVSYKTKGIGYSLLLICPESSFFVTLLLLTINSSNNLSRYIFDSATKNSDTLQSNEMKMYLKSFLINAVYIIIISFVNALIEYLLNPIIKI